MADSERIRVNTDIGPAEVRRYCDVDAAAQPLLRSAAQRLRLSARACHRAQAGADERRIWQGQSRLERRKFGRPVDWRHQPRHVRARQQTGLCLPQAEGERRMR